MYSDLTNNWLIKQCKYLIYTNVWTNIIALIYTQNICITFVERRPNVFDVCPTSYTCYTNDLCLDLLVWPVSMK